MFDITVVTCVFLREVDNVIELRFIHGEARYIGE